MDRIGRYVVERVLGHGAMGRVFLARDPALERKVAIKLLHEHVAERAARERFRDEAKVLAALSHPGIVTIFEIGTHEGRDFIAMEYLPGTSLRDVLRNVDRAARRDELVAICAHVAAAVAAAHRAGILHRDIKPENVVVAESGAVKVVDFGIAQRLHVPPHRIPTPVDERIEELMDAFNSTIRVVPSGGADTVLSAGTQTVFGTPGYMAPELLMTSTASEASDVYSLGVMLYECIAGHRPYDAPSLVEMIAIVIDDSQPIPPIADPLFPLVEQMLAREPSARPSLDRVVAELAETPHRTWPRWLAVGAAAVALAVGAGMGQRTRSHHVAHAKAGLLTVEAIETALPAYGANPPAPNAVAETLGIVLAQLDGMTVVGPYDVNRKLDTSAPASSADTRRAQRALGVKWIVRGSIKQNGRMLHAAIELATIDGAVYNRIALDRPVAQLAVLVDDLAQQIARNFETPKRDPVAAKALAAQLYGRGNEELDANNFLIARTYLEQAVHADPTFYRAWAALALVREWTAAPEHDTIAAIDATIATSTSADPDHKQLLEGIARYMHRDFAGARRVLEPLEKAARLAKREQRDLLYYLGEAHWHDGHHDTAIAYFERALALDVKFKPATKHPGEYALARRNAEMASRVLAIQEFEDATAAVAFALGHYDELRTSSSYVYREQADVVLGTVPPDFGVASNELDSRIARISVAIGRGDSARAQLDELWVYLAGDPTRMENSTYSLVMLAEVLISNELVDDARRVLTLLAKDSSNTAYQRLSILAAGIARDRRLVVRERLTDRLRELATAIDAELAGDRERAATLLDKLVRDPTPFWDYPERAALLRNLRALGRTKEAQALCAQTLKPAIFRLAFFALRRACMR